MTIRIVAEHSLCCEQFHLFVMDKRGGELFSCRELEFKQANMYESQRPTCSINEAAAQELFNSLWSAGLRPERESTEGQRRAMESHISDLRKIAFSALGVDE